MTPGRREARILATPAIRRCQTGRMFTSWPTFMLETGI